MKRILLSSLFLLLALNCACKNQATISWGELTPIFAQNNLTLAEPRKSHKDTTEIEEADAKLYGPIAGTTIFLEASRCRLQTAAT